MQHWIQCKTLEMMDHPLPAAETEHSPEGGGGNLLLLLPGLQLSVDLLSSQLPVWASHKAEPENFLSRT